MSQQKEKSIRREAERSYGRWRRRADRAERSARFWRRMFLAALAVLLLLALTTGVKSEATETPEAAPEVAPVARVIPATAPAEPEPADEPDRVRIIENCVVTHYDCCVACCGKADGITASGVRAVPGVTVAVDPSVIPLGSTLLVDYGDGILLRYRADDTGGAVKGNHIDLCVADHETALRLGVRTATVYYGGELT